MITRREANATLIGGIALAAMTPIGGHAEEIMKLPPAQIEGGKPLMETFKLRRSTRMYEDRPLSPQVLSNLLWAASGVNRSESGLRTAPSWRGRAHVDLYLAMSDGIWIYDAKAHQLVQHAKEDLRGDTTTEQPFVRAAPLNIVYVADADRLEEVSPESRIIAGVADTAMIGQNVYLFCASEGLGCVIRGLVPREKLAKRLNLRPTQTIYLAQTVGYPKA